MTEFLGLLLFVFPVLSSMVFAVVGKQQIRTLFRVQLAVIVFALLFLSTAGEFTVSTPLVFMGEPLWLSFSRTPLLLFLAAVLTLGILLFAVKQQEGRLSRIEAVLLNVTLAFGFAAFFSGQFLMRYISLEMVGLIAALSTLEWTEERISLARFHEVFILLRLGDLSLLISILLLWVDSGTLNIEEMIGAAVGIPGNRQIWIIAGVIAAAAIKLAVWPFWAWLRCAESKKQRPTYWISAILVPSLGMYLLYRFVPLIKVQLGYQISLALVAFVLMILPWLLRRAKRIRVSRFLVISSMMGAMFFYAAASGSSGAMVFYALGWIIFRLLLVFQDREYIRASRYRTLFLLLIVFALPGFFLVREASFGFSLGWVFFTLLVAAGLVDLGLLSSDKSAVEDRQAGDEDGALTGAQTEISPNKLVRERDRMLGTSLINQRSSGLPGILGQTADWLYAHVEQGFDQHWIGVERVLMGVSKFTLGKVEQAGIDRADSLIRGLVYRIGEHEKHSKETHIRWALLWIPIMLVFVLIVMLSSQNG